MEFGYLFVGNLCIVAELFVKFVGTKLFRVSCKLKLLGCDGIALTLISSPLTAINFSPETGYALTGALPAMPGWTNCPSYVGMFYPKGE